MSTQPKEALEGPRYLIEPGKFRDPTVTADGEPRAHVTLQRLETLWINTGTLCNLTCRNCYIESSPRNDSLAWITRHEVRAYLDEIEGQGLGTREIGFTGGEPFMNPEMIGMLEDVLERGFEALVLTNAMRPMMKVAEPLAALNGRHGERLTVRVSMDHYRPEWHEWERGAKTWRPAMAGLRWLSEQGFRVSVAGRRFTGECEQAVRDGFAAHFRHEGIAVDAHDPEDLVLFPEMDPAVDVPEITEGCWDKLGRHPDSVMCAGSRMVVKRKGAERPAVVACTLLPYDPQFELGSTLADAQRTVPLNHPFCAQFCVLGGASCSAS
ncbi:radical SAM protein [Arhodomonas sp. SL1]|uniref:radical SAM protein n=1 Tax=Arhodomonas sp. SL1 TaxID=3425691 RepID=UPI003F881581